MSFALPFIKAMQKDGHEFVLTCRDSGNTVALLERYNLQFRVVGKSVRRTKIAKLLFFPFRVISLYRYIRKESPQRSFGQSSFYLPIVSLFLGIPSLYTNDNEHARGNLLGFLFARTVYLPSVLSNKPFVRRWPLRKKVHYYPGIKEAIYLSRSRGPSPKEKEIKATIYFRPEPWSAQYYRGPVNFFDSTLAQLAAKYKVMVLPRDPRQCDYYEEKLGGKISVARKPIALEEILANCLLFIGAGGSMTREMAVLGVPTVSIYQDEILEVDKYLIDKRMMHFDPNISYEQLEEIISRPRNGHETSLLLAQGQESFDLFSKVIVDGSWKN